jgi:FeS assembly protein IscX
MNWRDAEDIGFELFEAFPEMNPIGVRFTDLHKMVIELPEFDDDPQASNERKLEAIQMSWLEEYQDGQ